MQRVGFFDILPGEKPIKKSSEGSHVSRQQQQQQSLGRYIVFNNPSKASICTRGVTSVFEFRNCSGLMPAAVARRQLPSFPAAAAFEVRRALRIET